MTTINEALIATRRALEESGSLEAPLEAEVLACFADVLRVIARRPIHPNPLQRLPARGKERQQRVDRQGVGTTIRQDTAKHLVDQPATVADQGGAGQGRAQALSSVRHSGRIRFNSKYCANRR